jgi:hypothetical protein
LALHNLIDKPHDGCKDPPSFFLMTCSFKVYHAYRQKIRKGEKDSDGVYASLQGREDRSDLGAETKRKD